MIDREKVIKGLECCADLQRDTMHRACDVCPYNDDPRQGTCVTLFPLFRDALGLLKAEQERNPVKPEVEHSGGGITWWNVCGACKTAINPNDKYCHECGATIDWGPDDDRTD